MNIVAHQPPKPIGVATVGRLQVQYGSSGREFDIAGPISSDADSESSYEDALRGAQELSRSSGTACAVMQSASGKWQIVSLNIGREAMRVLSAPSTPADVTHWRFTEVSKNLRSIVTPTSVVEASTHR